MDESAKDGKPRWVQTAVNVDDHIVVPRLDAAAVASDPEKAMEYVASLSLLPMDRCRPLWEFHFHGGAPSAPLHWRRHVHHDAPGDIVAQHGQSSKAASYADTTQAHGRDLPAATTASAVFGRLPRAVRVGLILFCAGLAHTCGHGIDCCDNTVLE